MTAPAFKMLVIYPASRYVAERSFINSEIDPGQSANWINECLSASGAAPSSHGWCCFHADVAQGLKWANRIGTLASVAVPVDFETDTRANQVAFLNSMQSNFISNAGSYIVAVANDAGDNITGAMMTAAKSALGLQSINYTQADEEI